MATTSSPASRCSSIGVAGFKVWQHYEQTQQPKHRPPSLLPPDWPDGGSGQAAEAFAKIAQNAPSGYATTARLAEADALLAPGKTADAVALYKQIAAKEMRELGDVARIRAAWAMADTASKSDLQTLLAPLLKRQFVLAPYGARTARL